MRHNKNWRKAILRMWKNRWSSNSWRKKMSDVRRRCNPAFVRRTKILWNELEYRTMMAKAQSKNIHQMQRDPKFREKARDAIKKSGYFGSSRQREISRRTMSRLWRSPEFAEQVRINAPKGARSPEHQIAMKKLWESEEFLNKIHHSQNHPSKPQRSIFRQLCRAGIRGIKSEVRCGPYSIDIAHLPKMLAIEVDDREYWHARPYRKALDKKKDKFLRANGWRVLRIPALKEEGKALIERLKSKFIHGGFQWHSQRKTLYSPSKS